MTKKYQTERYLEQRIGFFDKIISRFLIISGLILLGTQIVKIFLEAFNYSIFFTSLLAIVIFVVGFRNIPGICLRFAYYRRDKLGIKTLIFGFPIILTLVVIFVKIIVGYKAWDRMNTEGGLIEYGTSFAYILAFIFALPISKIFWQQGNKKLAAFYILIALFFLLIGLEEISWGQRLLGLNSPDFFKNYNSQSEITFHNLVWVKNYMDKACMVLGLLGSMGWIIIKKYNKNVNKYLLPSWFLSSFFLIVFSFFAFAEYVKDTGLIIEYQGLKQNFLPFAEFVELILSLGFLAFVIINFFRQSLEINSKISSP